MWSIALGRQAPVDLLHDGDEVVEVLEDVDGVHLVERVVAEGEAAGQVGDDLDAGDGADVKADGAGYLAVAAAEIDAPGARHGRRGAFAQALQR